MPDENAVRYDRVCWYDPETNRVMANPEIVQAAPAPYVLCPACFEMNAVPLPGLDATCDRCGHNWPRSEDDVLPLNRCREGEWISYRIYLIRNKQNRRIYVGQTSQPLEQRTWQYQSNWLTWHCRWRHSSSQEQPSVYKQLIMQAMIEHGFDAFDMIFLEAGCGTRRWAETRERKWIFRVNSMEHAMGYNKRCW